MFPCWAYDVASHVTNFRTPIPCYYFVWFWPHGPTHFIDWWEQLWTCSAANCYCCYFFFYTLLSFLLLMLLLFLLQYAQLCFLSSSLCPPPLPFSHSALNGCGWIVIDFPLAAASMWTRKDIKEFKESLVKDKESVIKIGSGETVTVSGENVFCFFASVLVHVVFFCFVHPL